MCFEDELLNYDAIIRLLVVFLAYLLLHSIIRIFAKKQKTSNYCKKLKAKTEARIALHQAGIDPADEKASDCPSTKSRQSPKKLLSHPLTVIAVGELIKLTIQTGWAWALAHVLDFIAKFRQ